MDDAFEKGVVLVMSMWDDHEVCISPDLPPSAAFAPRPL